MLTGGARSATVDAIAAESGAPKGSIYHRFASVDEVLTEMWIRGVRRSQETFMEALRDPEPLTAALAGGRAIHDFASREPADARLLAAMRREDLVQTVSNPRLMRELERLNRPVEVALRDLAQRLFGRASRAAVEATVLAAVDIPQGAIRRHLAADTPLPRGLCDQIEAAARASLARAGATVSTSNKGSARRRNVGDGRAR